MTPEHCAELLREADPDRFASVMAAQPGDRAKLATLYAANLDIARAAVASGEPLISQMRLQWWTDQIAEMAEGRPPARHDIAAPLFESWGAEIKPLAAIVEARHRDVVREPFASVDEVKQYIGECTGGLMRLAGIACGLRGQDDLVAAQALGAGIAAWLGAYPQIRALNLGLSGDSGDALSGLADAGLQALDSARRVRPKPPGRAAPALFAGAGARKVLVSVKGGKPPVVTEFTRKFAYVALAIRGRWQG
ncbi:squalene/phytoene synthase family protein [Paracoccus albus]|uniref:squalene/phytoene synthase family protein n=1 Tax=Paracoccus albus TaxID=3017784 RepID=UPI0022F0C95B|nr:squalene/phytoene synthase family protein [Paracoccus albus]WBU61348.1 squalene/phytoene synthase family protein [Paracoccus albus]